MSKTTLKIIISLKLVFFILTDCKKNDIKKDTNVGNIENVESVQPEKSENETLINPFENVNYSVGEYSGTNFPNYSFKVISFLNEKKQSKQYLLLYDNRDRLMDTLNINSKDVSLKVIFSNQAKGIALGDVNSKNVQDVFFKISDLYEVDTLNYKFTKTNFNREVKYCEIPIEYLSEDYAGIEDYFSYGINKSNSGENQLNNQRAFSHKYNVNSSNFNLNGEWRVSCKKNNTSNLLIHSKKEGNIDIYKEDGFLCRVVIKNEELGNNFNYVGIPRVSLNFEASDTNLYSQDSLIVTYQIISEDKISINWLGFYNVKTKKREFTQNPFSKENPVILTRCK